MSQSKNLIVLQEELTKEEGYVCTFEALRIGAGCPTNVRPLRQTA